MWPLLTGANTTQPRPLTPVTEVSIVDTSDSAHCERQTTRAHLLAPSLIATPVAMNSTRLFDRRFAVAAGWKLITLAGQSGYYTPNSTQVPPTAAYKRLPSGLRLLTRRRCCAAAPGQQPGRHRLPGGASAGPEAARPHRRDRQRHGADPQRERRLPRLQCHNALPLRREPQTTPDPQSNEPSRVL